MCLCKGKEVVFAFPFWLLNFQSKDLDMAEPSFKLWEFSLDLLYS